MIDPSGTNTSRPAHMRAFDKQRLSTLIDMDSPEAIHKEVLHTINLIRPQFDAEPVNRILLFTVDLYKGQHEEYKACNTDYHNLRHITDTYLAMARLLHGAHLSNKNFSEREIVLGLTGALMHDTGMIQKKSDIEGTGAKYTQDHVELSMDFMEKHAATLNLESHEVVDLRDMILCTDLAAEIPAINFSSQKIELLGKMLATADLIAQMADHTYLEKLLFLYHEFKEADIGDFKNEVDFLYHTLHFFEVSETRFKKTLANTSSYLVPHFKARWDINENLYLLSLENQRKFLKKIMTDKNKSVYQELKRDNIVQKVRQKFGDTGLGE
jgi:hypothetical protein